jgi:hypothetical protein
MSMNNPKSYEIAHNDGSIEIVSGVDSYNLSNGMLIFQATDDRGSIQTVKAVRIDGILSFAVVADPEKIVKPKYTFFVTLQDGTSKSVKADIYRVSSVSGNAVYEFFTQVTDNSNGACREEFTAPFDSVKYIERIEPDADKVVVPATDSAS